MEQGADYVIEILTDHQSASSTGMTFGVHILHVPSAGHRSLSIEPPIGRRTGANGGACWRVRSRTWGPDQSRYDRGHVGDRGDGPV